MRGKWASWLNLILGVWLIVAPFALAYSGIGRAVVNDVIVGVLVIIFAAIAIASASINWASWVNVVLGVWEIIAPFALGYSGRAAAVWNDVLVGAGFVVFGLIAASAGGRGAVATTATGYDRGYGTEQQRRDRGDRAA